MSDCYNEAEQAPVTPVDHFGGQQQVWLKSHTVVLRRGQACKLILTMVNGRGDPLDLSDCFDSGESSSVTGDAPQIKLRMVDPICATAETPTTRDGEVIDAAAGKVSVQLQKDDVTTPGIYIAEVAAVDPDDEELIVTSTQFCVWIEPGLFGNGTNLLGPPQLRDVRLRLRDFAPENELLDTVDFDGSEVAHALIQPILDWNETPPILRRRYTTSTFPHRGAWLAAACGYLFRLAAEHYRRNQLPYQAGGSSFDDKNKAREYDSRGDMLLAEWKAFLRSAKIAENMANGFGGIGSGYRRGIRGW